MVATVAILICALDLWSLATNGMLEICEILCDNKYDLKYV